MPSTYEHIASYTVTGSATSSITLSSIPATYTDLELITSTKCSASYNNDSASVILNGDTASNYYWTQIKGPTSGAIYSNGSGASGRAGALVINDMTSTKFSADTMFFNGYADTTGYKTIMSRFHGDNIGYFSAMWKSTSAINSIKLLVDTAGDAFQIGTTVNLYGIKAA